jgi:hypothetical protein
MRDFQKVGGIASLLQAMVYIAAFIFFGAFWQYPTGADAVIKQAYLSENQLSLSLAYLIMYVLFGVLLAVLVTSLHAKMKKAVPTLSSLASVFGVIWVGLVIASGMIANIGLEAVVNLSDPENAIATWSIVTLVVEGLGGGNEVVGGLWVLLVSLGLLKSKQLTKAINYLGVFVGSIGIFTLYPAEVLTEIFGLSQIVWFIWLGLALLRDNKAL